MFVCGAAEAVLSRIEFLPTHSHIWRSMRIAACFAFMYATKIEVGDLVVVHDTMAGKVLGKFRSKTGNEIYDVGVVTNWGVTRVAALDNSIVKLLGKPAQPK